MKDLFVPYEIAIELKELGFDEPCVGAHHSRIVTVLPSKKKEKISFTFGMFQYPKRNSDANTVSGTFIGENGCYTPLYQQAFSYLLPMIEHKTINNYIYRIILIKSNGNYLLQRKFSNIDSNFENYSDGTNEDCIGKLIELIKNKK